MTRIRGIFLPWDTPPARPPCPQAGLFLFIAFLPVLGNPFFVQAEPPSGIQPLQVLSGADVHSLIHGGSVRPLLTAKEQEAFLHELERHPPNWDRLHDPPGAEHGARLFSLNRRRDELREGHTLLTQRLAFLWSGILREYQPERQGFTVVMGPKFTQTTWGLVRFKPVGLPHEMVAVPTPGVLPSLLKDLRSDKQIEVDILFIGTLIPWESIIYGFSHDGLEQGMVMPVVKIDAVHYVLNHLPR